MLYKVDAGSVVGTHPVSTMPVDASGHYWVVGPYHTRTISRMTRVAYSRARNSPRHTADPYPSPIHMMTRMDASGQEWFSDVGEDLYLRDFIFHTRMQTARRMSERSARFPRHDRVLDRLMEEGTFDRSDRDIQNPSDELAMAHSAAMVQRLLMRIEALEGDIRISRISPA
jgi:hypothetical protein